MVSAWYMDPNCEADQREEHRYNPNRPVSLEELKQKTGVEYFTIKVEDDGETYDVAALDKIRAQRGYTYEDELTITREKLPDYDSKLKTFYTEHLHSDEEIRFFLDGTGYFDVRDGNDEWIRIELTAGDMIILPAGIYHRFTLDTKNYVRVKRFFVGDPVWTPHDRPSDNHPARANYVHRFQAAA